VTTGAVPERQAAPDDPLPKALELLEAHHVAFTAARPFAEMTGHTVPCDTKSWSEILIGILTTIKGRQRKKGTDLSDGSDVKAANTLCAIDTPRFNGAIPAGRTSKASSKPANIHALDETPYIFFVLWDEMGAKHLPRVRVWVVRAQKDEVFRNMCASWYEAREDGTITSTNFQLHPPRGLDTNEIRNTFGNLQYPLLFAAVRENGHYKVTHFDAEVLKTGACVPA
jgi:hypothetical protein